MNNRAEPKFVWREVLGTARIQGSDYVHVHLSCGHKVVLHMGVTGCQKSLNRIQELLGEVGSACTKIQCYLCPGGPVTVEE